MRTARREAVVQIPTIGLALPTSIELGICRANEFTLKPFSVSCPTSERFAPYSRSNTRRSRKNGSSACPAHERQLPHFAPVTMASLESVAQFGIEASPTSDGAT